MKNIFKKYMQWAYPECEHLNIALRFLLKNPEQNKLAIEEIYFALMKTNGYFYEDVALNLALTALRPVSRERVEKVWGGEWKCHGDCGVTECSACGWNIEEYVGNYNFCPVCGAPMTDEAVEMVMERMEALYEQ